MPKRFSESRKISRGRSPWEILRVEGNLEGGGDGFPTTSLVLVEHGYNVDNIHFVAQFISWVENQSDQYGTQSPGFGGFGGLLVSGPMLLVEQTTKTFYLGRKALHFISRARNPMYYCIIVCYTIVWNLQ